MRGFLRRTVPLWVRRLVTMLPALIVAGAGADPTRALVISHGGLSSWYDPSTTQELLRHPDLTVLLIKEL